MSPRASRGMALVTVLLVMSLFTALGLGLSLGAGLERAVQANHREATALLYAADAGLALAAREVARHADFDAWLRGAAGSALVDGPPGPRVVAGGDPVDLVALTHELTCGRPAPCADADVTASTVARPWGPNNPRWRLIVHGHLSQITGAADLAPPAYVAVWIGDDGGEVDGDPWTDGVGESPGRDVVRAYAVAFGGRGGRRDLDAQLVRLCHRPAEGEARCEPGIRVQSWREASAALP